MRLFHRLACLALVVVAELPIAAASEPRHGGLVRVGVALDLQGSDLAQIATAMIAEADAIWRPNGVTVVRVSGDIAPADVRLKVRVKAQHGLVATWQTGQRASVAHGTLGEIVFGEDGGPTDAIALDVDAVVATIKAAPSQGVPASVCDADACLTALLTSMTARALGRVLAHEIGHYILALRSHVPYGLMRSAFAGRELSAPDRHTFALSASLVPRLRDKLALLRHETQADESERPGHPSLGDDANR